jgi:protein CpxP
MKKAIIITGLMLIAMNGVYAQQMQKQPGQQTPMPMTPEKRAQMITDKLTKLLNLTDKQKKEVYAVNLEETQKMQAAMDKHEKPDMPAIIKDRDAKFKNILTPGQLEKFKGVMPGNRGQNTPPPPMPH